MLIKGIVYNHVQYCEDSVCLCKSIISSIDRYTAYLKLLKEKKA